MPQLRSELHHLPDDLDPRFCEAIIHVVDELVGFLFIEEVVIPILHLQAVSGSEFDDHRAIVLVSNNRCFDGGLMKTLKPGP